MHIAGIARALPKHYYSQAMLTEMLAELWQNQLFNKGRLQSLHEHMLIGGRHLALPLPAYRAIDNFTASNAAYLEVGADLGCEVAALALSDAGLKPCAVDHLFFVSVTGIATPSLDTRICNRLGLRSDVKRTPIFGLGCVAGAAGLARAADAVRGQPGDIAMLVSVELCSLTLQTKDLSMSGLIASGLFGDGAAAVVLTEAEAEADLADAASKPFIVASRSVLYPNSEDVLGWNISSEGFKIVLAGNLHHLLGSRLRQDVDDFLASAGLCLKHLTGLVCHPGGPKIMQTVEEALTLPPTALRHTRESLRDVGNVSSASVLFVLEDTMRKERPAPGAYFLLLAFGPGFCCEMVLLRWGLPNKSCSLASVSSASSSCG